MSLEEIALPEVTAHLHTVKFSKEKNSTYIEIKNTGTSETSVRKVRPEDMARYRNEWMAFCDGMPPSKELRKGISLKMLNGMNDELEQKFISYNVHNIEEFAALSDMQCQTLGHGTLTLRKQAQERLGLLRLQQQEQAVKVINEAAASVKPVPDAQYASQDDLVAVKESVASLDTKMDAILAALGNKPLRGRPKKVSEENP